VRLCVQLPDDLRARLPSQSLPPWNAELAMAEYLENVEAHLAGILKKPALPPQERSSNAAPAVRAPAFFRTTA
jgi:hypothetical protein